MVAARNALRSLAVLLVLPAAASAEPAAEPEVLAEAMFLADTLPPTEREIDLAFALEHEPAGGVAASPDLQLAIPIEERIGLTVDAGLGAGGLEHPGAALKVLLREASPGNLGLSASVDWHASPGGGGDVALAVGALGQAGPLGLRAALLAVTGTSAWRPRPGAGLSAALEPHPGLRLLCEVVAERAPRGAAISAGPTVKLSLGGASLLAGALVELGRPGHQALALQVARPL